MFMFGAMQELPKPHHRGFGMPYIEREIHIDLATPPTWRPLGIPIDHVLDRHQRQVIRNVLEGLQFLPLE